MNLEDQKELLVKGNHTCVLVKENEVLVSDKSGIAPLMDFIAEGKNLRGFTLADRIIGKAAASLAVCAGILYVYGKVMSEAGIRYLEEHHVSYSYDVRADKIINRSGTDICPMEKTVMNLESPEECYQALREKINEIRKK